MSGRKGPARARSDATIRDRGKLRPLVVTLYPNGMIGLRPLGLRREETLDVDTAWQFAVRVRVASERAERRKKAERR
jgi:hypothetical protein